MENMAFNLAGPSSCSLGSTALWYVIHFPLWSTEMIREYPRWIEFCRCLILPFSLAISALMLTVVYCLSQPETAGGKFDQRKQQCISNRIFIILQGELSFWIWMASVENICLIPAWCPAQSSLDRQEQRVNVLAWKHRLFWFHLH